MKKLFTKSKVVLTHEIKEYIDNTMYCWLATIDKDGKPSISPKEMFMVYKDETIIVANVSSAGSEKNIKQNSNVSIGFVDVIVQTGYRLTGEATIVKRSDPEFAIMKAELTKITNGLFLFKSIFKIKITKAKKMISPNII